MGQVSAYEISEIIEMVNSDDQEEQGVGARNLWAFWNGWQEQFEKSDKPEQKVKDVFSVLAPRLLELLVSNIKELKKKEGYSMPRHIWHYILSLGCLQYKPALELLQEILFDLSIVENVRGFAADALGRFPSGFMSSELEEKLWGLSETDMSLPVRINSIRAIASNYFNSKNGEIAKKIWKLITEQQNPTILTALTIAVGEIGSMEVVPDLVHTLITRRTGTMKKDAGLSLDRIAELNGLENREALINSVKGIEMDQE